MLKKQVWEIIALGRHRRLLSGSCVIKQRGGRRRSGPCSWLVSTAGNSGQLLLCVGHGWLGWPQSSSLLSCLAVEKADSKPHLGRHNHRSSEAAERYGSGSSGQGQAWAEAAKGEGKGYTGPSSVGVLLSLSLSCLVLAACVVEAGKATYSGGPWG